MRRRRYELLKKWDKKGNSKWVFKGQDSRWNGESDLKNLNLKIKTSFQRLRNHVRVEGCRDSDKNFKVEERKNWTRKYGSGTSAIHATTINVGNWDGTRGNEKWDFLLSTRETVSGMPCDLFGKLGIIHHKSEVGKGTDSELSGYKPGTDIEEISPSPQKDLFFCVYKKMYREL